MLVFKKRKYYKIIKEAEEYKKKGLLEDAVKKYNEAFEIIVNIGDYFNLACIYSDLGKYDKAIHIFEEIRDIKIDRGDNELSDVYFSLGFCHDSLKQNALAIECYEEAIKRGCDIPECYFFLAYIYDELNLDENAEETKKALEYYKKAISLCDTYLYAYVNLGNIYARLGHYEDSYKCFLKAKELDKDDLSTSCYNLAVSLNNLGKTDEALYYYLEELKRKEPYPSTYYNLGILYKDKKEYNESLKYYLKAIEIDKEDYDAWYNLACLYALMNDFDNAFSCLTFIKYNKRKYLETTKTDDELIELRKDKRYEELFK